MNPEEFISVTCFGREFEKVTGRRCRFNGRKIYLLVVDGAIPATRRNNRWGQFRRDFPQVTEAISRLDPEHAPETAPATFVAA